MTTKTRTVKTIQKYIPLVLIFWCLSTPLKSQIVGSWYEAGVDIDLPKSFSLSAEVDLRTTLNNGLSVYQYFPQIQLKYKINKRFDVSASYRFLQAKEDNNHFYTRNKFYFNFHFDFPVERFKIKNRTRYHLQYRTYIEDEDDRLPDRYLRDKFEISYNINNNPIDPFLSFEIYYPLNQHKINTIDEYRVAAGIEFPLAKDHDMELGIMYNVERFPAPERAIILLVSYGFSAN